MCRNFIRDSSGRTAVNEREVSTNQEDKACLSILSPEESSIANLRNDNRPLGMQEAHFKALFIIECWRVRWKIIGLKAKSAMRLGIAMSPFRISAIVHTNPRFPMAPMGIAMTHNILNG